MKIGLAPAAGLATRLNIHEPKELLPFSGRPIIDYSIDHLLGAGVDQIVIVIREGKEAIRDHLLEAYPQHSFEYVYQQGTIGNLLDAIRASHATIRGAEVYFCMPDTHIRPNPFGPGATSEITLLCFIAEDESWQHFGVLDLERHRLVDKPKEYVGNVCWGALVWRPVFTERLLRAETLPAAINQVDWSYRISIESYVDIGIG